MSGFSVTAALVLTILEHCKTRVSRSDYCQQSCEMTTTARPALKSQDPEKQG